MPFVKGKCKLLSLFIQKDGLNVEILGMEQISSQKDLKKRKLTRIKAEGKKTWATKGNTEVYAEIGYVEREVTWYAWQWDSQKGGCQNVWR